ncbi:hypothetical protein U1Q18_044800 [Sarracenia purpurea var. burkii]
MQVRWITFSLRDGLALEQAGSSGVGQRILDRFCVLPGGVLPFCSARADLFYSVEGIWCSPMDNSSCLIDFRHLGLSNLPKQNLLHTDFPISSGPGSRPQRAHLTASGSAQFLPQACPSFLPTLLWTQHPSMDSLQSRRSDSYQPLTVGTKKKFLDALVLVRRPTCSLRMEKSPNCEIGHHSYLHMLSCLLRKCASSLPCADR